MEEFIIQYRCSEFIVFFGADLEGTSAQGYDGVYRFAPEKGLIEGRKAYQHVEDIDKWIWWSTKGHAPLGGNWRAGEAKQLGGEASVIKVNSIAEHPYEVDGPWGVLARAGTDTQSHDASKLVCKLVPPRVSSVTTATRTVVEMR